MSLKRLDHGRLRSTRGWQTAVEADLAFPHWRIQVERGRFYATAHCAIDDDVLDSNTRHAGRRAARNAILQTLAVFELI